jgi:ribose-phosphate pyrophosphokinase
VALPLDANVAGGPAILVDDVCSTGETLAEAATLLRAHGAGPVRALVTHALFDPAAAARMRKAGIERIVSTDSVAHPSNEISLAGLLASALQQDLTG